MIEFINVNKKFGEKLVLHDLNLTIQEGSIVGLVGANGSGKSTILRLLSGVMLADAGVVRVDNQEVYDNDLIKQEIFFLADDPYFFSQSTILDMKRFYKIFYKNFSDDLFETLLADFKLDVNAKINSFSKGMKRQVSVILALSCQAKILLLDEAFDGLDPLMRFKLRQYITDKTYENNSIVVISSHNLRELEDICDTIAIIDNHQLKMNHSTQEYLDLYHRYQLAFQEPVDPQVFQELNPIHVSGKSQLFTLILKGDKEILDEKIAGLKPIINERSNVSLEEIYVYELEDKQ
ncbi:ABC transporter ATP-binding protein [Erysipelothrix urinaevulpis]|uniref:ABC transporter ATP-binding protein n=1 Tax=Erysipelothrix urinaevulpis TaxID=2683717 RepID=UPI00135ADD6B|nr:ABC transporter ATP-binding protein [Erysipelothrix urinaevulpis]